MFPGCKEDEEAFYKEAKPLTKMPEQLSSVKDNRFVKFLFNFIKHSGKIPIDINENNVAVVDGKYKMFDCW
jgi:hypothetical protein